jgi:cytochrome b subunit of formate dehydrogenase/nitrate/TMAO reductase-like tetraheme cytochrome c subunit
MNATSPSVVRSARAARLAVLALLGLLPGFGAVAAGAEAIANQDCLDCHAEAQTRKVQGKEMPLPAFPTNAFKSSIHGKLNCVDCHTGIKEAVHESTLPRPQCLQCHPAQPNHEQAAAAYQVSIHGRSLGGLVLAACSDCHGAHEIVSPKSTNSPIYKLNLASTCAKCHTKVEKIYRQSIHGQLLTKGDKRAPVCTDCHPGHKIESPNSAHFKQTSDERCGKCHQDRLKHYRDTYHGKALALVNPRVVPEVAACYDCHGHHNVLPPHNPASQLSSSNIVQTCSKCHEGANNNFTMYRSHANPLDREHYPVLHATFIFMTTLLLCVFAFFGAHTLFWLVRSVIIRMKDPAAYRQMRKESENGGQMYVRFTPYERFLHFLVITSFLTLVITGMPLKFYHADWARLIFRLLGGPEAARFLHHFAAVVTFGYFGLHLGSLIKQSYKNRAVLKDPATGKYQLKRLWPIIFGPDSMIPTWVDVKDFVAHYKWFFGRGPKPQFDRWTYWERFDYFAVFWGVAIIGLSGLILWFPLFFTKYLPGWIINVALIVHSDEALLAAGFIFTIHFFNTHFRLEKFPMDTVIFSGRMSEGELVHERKRWYDRLVASGRLETSKVSDDWFGWKNIVRTLGFIFFGTGVVLLALIIYAMAVRLLAH